MTDSGGTWQFLYDTTAGIPAVIEEVTPSGSVNYIREPNGALIARVSGGSIRFYHFDALGSTRLLTDADGDVTDTYAYDAWGNATHNGETAQPYQYVGQLGYYTHVQDENFDLLQLGVRLYDPEVGRFTQRDPVRHGENWYAYVGNAPLHNVDPLGLKRDEEKLKQCLRKARNDAIRDFALLAVAIDYPMSIALLGCVLGTGPGMPACVIVVVAISDVCYVVAIIAVLNNYSQARDECFRRYG